MWRLQAWFVPTSQEARSSSAPDEGAALSGCDPPDEGQRQCCLDNVRMRSSGPTKKYGDRVKNRHKWSAGRRACRYNGTRHLRKVPDYDVAPFGAPLPHACEGKENEGAAPRLTMSGADESRPYEIVR